MHPRPHAARIVSDHTKAGGAQISWPSAAAYAHHQVLKKSRFSRQHQPANHINSCALVKVAKGAGLLPAENTAGAFYNRTHTPSSIGCADLRGSSR